MQIRLYKPVSLYLLKKLDNKQILWESQLSRWLGFKVTLPKYFWEIHLFMVHNKIPATLTIECHIDKGWYSVFYSYNLKGDLKKYMEITLARKCRQDHLKLKRLQAQTIFTKTG